MLYLNTLLLGMQQAGTEEWLAEGHLDKAAWLSDVGHVVSWVLLLLLFYLLLCALRRHSRYRAEGVLSAADLEQLKAEIASAERRTVGEILPIVVERSDAHPQAHWLCALTFGVLGSAILASDLPFDQPLLVLLAQLAMGAVGYGLAYFLPDFGRLFVLESRAEEMAEEQAFQEFHRYGLHRTEAQTGVLLFVSLFERRVVVLADEGINAKVGKDHWAKTASVILEQIAKGSLKQGLTAGIQSAALVLEEHFPWTDGDRNEIPDRIIVRKQ